MAEAITAVGDLMAASLQQSMDWYGETFTIIRSTVDGYSPSTGIAFAPASSYDVKGIWDERNYSDIGSNGTTVRGRERAVLIGSKNTSNEALAFIPGVGDLVNANYINDAIKAIHELRGAQGVTTFYRLILETA